MKKNVFLLFFSLFFLGACGNPAGESKVTDTALGSDLDVTKKVSDLEPRLFTADSLQVLYHDNPDGDSLRYTRFFTYTKTSDSAMIKSLVNELDQVYVQEPKTRPCRSEGKMYLLRGEDIIKTVYFSTRGDSCSFFYFVKDGGFYYLPLTASARKLLAENRHLARRPGTLPKP